MALWHVDILLGLVSTHMKNSHLDTRTETKALPKDIPIWIQPDLFEVAGIYEQSCGGEIQDFSDLIPSTAQMLGLRLR